jgi:protein gp37
MSTPTTNIEWTDRTWNPLRGCSRISPGCVNCYAEVIAARFSGPGQPFEGFADRKKAGSKWTGKVELVPAALDEPLGWRKPARVFVNSMSDLFHEALPIEAIARVFAVMYLAPQHTFQVLTKRADRMRHVLTHPKFYEMVLAAAGPLRRADPALLSIAISDPTKFPHSNVWLGVSVENQAAAEERIPLLLDTPAAIRFLSCEPLLGRLNIKDWLPLPLAPGKVWRECLCAEIDPKDAVHGLRREERHRLGDRRRRVAARELARARRSGSSR